MMNWKSFDLCVESVGGKLNGIIVARIRDFSSWI